VWLQLGSLLVLLALMGTSADTALLLRHYQP